MKVRRIITVPDPLLRQTATAVTDPRSREILTLVEDMKTTAVAVDGVGLAAPQVGILSRVIVVNYGASPYALLNPRLVWTSKGTSVLDEGCLSVPGIVVPVRRPKKIRVVALDESGTVVETQATDLLAKILQHEIDHLNGILITDYRATPAGHETARSGERVTEWEKRE